MRSEIEWTASMELARTVLTPAANMTAAEPSIVATQLGASLMGIFLLLGLVGNLLIMVAIVTIRKVWNVINIFIISLVINDLLAFALIVVFIIHSYASHAWSAGDVMCKLNPELTLLFTGCSLWHTALIAIHRYIVVCHNSAYNRMSKTAYVAFVLVVARAIPMLCVFPGFSLSTSHYVAPMLRCILKPSQGERIVLITTLLILVPCVVVVVCYALVFCFVWRMRRHMQSTDLILKREIQITKMFGVVFVMILLGFLPYTVLRTADSNNSVSADVYVVITVVYGIATCSNPLVYGAMSTDIRRACYTLLHHVTPCCRGGGGCACARSGAASGSGESSTANSNSTATSERGRPACCACFRLHSTRHSQPLQTTDLSKKHSTPDPSATAHVADASVLNTEAPHCLLATRDDVTASVDATDASRCLIAVRDVTASDHASDASRCLLVTRDVVL